MRKWKKYRKPKRKATVLDSIIVYLVILLVLIIFSLVLKMICNNQIVKKSTPQKKVVIGDIKRSEAYERGMNIINYRWEFNPEKNGTKGNIEVELPNYLKNEKEAKFIGLPYCWGGYLSVDKSNVPDIENFQDAIDHGYTAGNVDCSGSYKKNTAGLDCSGFVCAVFNISEKTDTSNLKLYFNKIKRKNLKPMDILNCEKKHVFIFLKDSEDKKGIITMEATLGKNSKIGGRTVINYRSWDYINKGEDGKPYVAMRYKKIIDDQVVIEKR